MTLNPLTNQPISDADFKSISKLAERQIALEAEIESREAELKKTREELEVLVRNTLPTAMNGVGMREFQLTNGARITLKKIYQCSLSDAEAELKDRGLAWLRANKLGDIIKKEFKVALNQEDEKTCRAVELFLNKRGLQYSLKEQVANPTLRSLMKERIEGGKSFPMDIFRGFAGKRSVIEIPD